MDIKVIGTGCEKCDRLYDNVKAALEETGKQAHLEKVEDLMEIVKMGVMSSPSLMIDGKLVVAGRVVKTKEIIKYLEEGLS